MEFKILAVFLILFIITQAVSGLFWDYLGFGGLFAICAIKGNCKGPHKRDTDGLKKVKKLFITFHPQLNPYYEIFLELMRKLFYRYKFRVFVSKD